MFAERYHARQLRTPREVSAGLGYVLGSFRRHAAQQGRRLARGWVDPYLSAPHFAGWATPIRAEFAQAEADVTASAETWLLRCGWRRGGGALDPDVMPGGVSSGDP